MLPQITLLEDGLVVQAGWVALPRPHVLDRGQNERAIQQVREAVGHLERDAPVVEASRPSFPGEEFLLVDRLGMPVDVVRIVPILNGMLDVFHRHLSTREGQSSGCQKIQFHRPIGIPRFVNEIELGLGQS